MAVTLHASRRQGGRNTGIQGTAQALRSGVHAETTMLRLRCCYTTMLSLQY